MVFNSYEFLVFLPSVFIVYWFVVNNSLKLQNLFLLFASYLFYGWWDWRFLSLIVISSFADFFIGKAIYRSDNPHSKYWLWLSILINLGFLGVFKYSNFFVDSFVDAFSLVGVELHRTSLNIILPVGISFYTFQTLSYSIDIYRKKIKPIDDIISFFAFVSFFPQLVAGPIERATNLLPQFEKKRIFDQEFATSGLRQILWGFFKKIVIADACAGHVDLIFDNYSTGSSSTLFLGAILFAFQIYCDFSGYSDIAIGTAKLFGFKLMKNFDNPYFSTSMTEVWRRWHISLSTWTNDYIFRPLMLYVGNKGKIGITYSLMVTFLVLGLWHGANWTFIGFGLLHGIVVSSEYYFQRQIRGLHSRINKPKVIKFLGWGITMVLWLAGCILFRSDGLSNALGYIKMMVINNDLLDLTPFLKLKFLPFWIFFLLVTEYLSRNREFGFDLSKVENALVRWGLYFLILGVIILFGVFGNEEFIYFQF